VCACEAGVSFADCGRNPSTALWKRAVPPKCTPLRSRRIKYRRARAEPLIELRRAGAEPLIELRRAGAEPRLGAPDKYPQYTDGVGSMRCDGRHIICKSYCTRRGSA
jgi:hypothetical protein